VSRTEIIHFAGPTLRIGSVVRQRCLWCGALIEELDLDRIAVADDPAADGGGLFTARWRGLVGVDGAARFAVDDPPDGKVPDRACSEVLPDLGPVAS
jgi:hypothetical protein